MESNGEKACSSVIWSVCGSANPHWKVRGIQIYVDILLNFHSVSLVKYLVVKAVGALLAGTLKAFGRKNRLLILMGLFSKGRFLWGRKVRVGQSIGWSRRRWVVFLRVFGCVHVTLSGGCVCVHTAACVYVCVRCEKYISSLCFKVQIFQYLSQRQQSTSFICHRGLVRYHLNG